MSKLTAFLLFLIKSNPWLVLLSIITGIATVFSGAALFGFSMYLILLTSLHPTMDLVLVPVVYVRVFGLSRALLRYAERLVSHNVTFRVLSDIRAYFFTKLEPVLPDLKSMKSNGSILSVAISDIENLQDAFLKTFYPFFVATGVVCLSSLVISHIHKWFALILLTGFVLAVLISFVMAIPVKSILQKLTIIKSEVYNFYIECFYGTVEIVVNLQDTVRKKMMTAKLNDEKKLENMLAIYASASSALSGLFPSLIFWALLAVSIWLITYNGIDRMMVAIIPVIGSTLFESVQPLFTLYSRLEKAKISSGNVFDFNKGYVLKQNNNTRVDCVKLSVENISFSYHNCLPVINNLSFTLCKGRSLAILGSSGIGKTTLLNILAGYLPSYQGLIKIDNVDIKTMDTDLLRQYYAVTEQQPFFFNDTIAENFRLLHPGCTNEQIIDILKRVEIFDKINALPLFIDSQMSETGANFSGGELQLLAIARALLRDAPVMFFDEPTAGLDTIRERKIIELILQQKVNKAIVVITHRRDMVSLFDDVLELDQIRQIQRAASGLLL
jgi:ATP-binding cassette subfamily C protein CydC